MFADKDIQFLKSPITKKDAIQLLLKLTKANLKEQGFWDASTNTPTLSNGIGTQGYFYIVSTSGTVDFGNGDITFSVGDWVFYGTNNQWTKFETGVSYVPEDVANKDASGGYAGLTLFKINFKNALNTFTSFLTNANTAARTYTFQDRDGTIANTDSETLTNTTLGNADSTQANARFTIPVATVITATTTLNASHWGKKLLFNPSSDIVITLPQQSTLATVAGTNLQWENIGTAKITWVKEGSETLTGNIDGDAGSSGSVFRNTTTNWSVEGGTFVQGFVINYNLQTVSDNTFPIIKPNFNGIITSISSICRSGTCTATIKIDSTAVTATANSVSTTEDIEAVTAANTFTNSNFINVTVSSNSSCLDMLLTISGTFRENA